MTKRVKIIVSVAAVMLVLSIVGTTARVMASHEESTNKQTQQGANKEELVQALNTALTNAVNQGLITQEQVDKIIERWERVAKIKRGVMFHRLFRMDEAKVDELLAKLQDEGKIDEDKAGKIKEKWAERRAKGKVGWQNRSESQDRPVPHRILRAIRIY